MSGSGRDIQSYDLNASYSGIGLNRLAGGVGADIRFKEVKITPVVRFIPALKFAGNIEAVPGLPSELYGSEMFSTASVGLTLKTEKGAVVSDFHHNAEGTGTTFWSISFSKSF